MPATKPFTSGTCASTLFAWSTSARWPSARELAGDSAPKKSHSVGTPLCLGDRGDVAGRVDAEHRDARRRRSCAGGSRRCWRSPWRGSPARARARRHGSRDQRGRSRRRSANRGEVRVFLNISSGGTETVIWTSAHSRRGRGRAGSAASGISCSRCAARWRAAGRRATGSRRVARCHSPGIGSVNWSGSVSPHLPRGAPLSHSSSSSL